MRERGWMDGWVDGRDGVVGWKDRKEAMVVERAMVRSGGEGGVCGCVWYAEWMT